MTDQGDHINLCKADADMLDRLVSVGFELDQLEGLSTEEEQRATNILHTFGLLERYPVEDADDALIVVTLARIDPYENKQRESTPPPRNSESGHRRMRTTPADVTQRTFRGAPLAVQSSRTQSRDTSSCKTPRVVS